ncbi:glycosyltransferase [Aequorivita sp. 609]|uniref:glycosyltransferase family 4 protein n=1 Tax=Aequorivita TaxID=153265 RepID=UPI00161CFE30|nr:MULTISPECIES: glycosyltransferase family 4 protein [Aequorivita]MBB6681133.1 glycosyltransferase [Aequorivita sp. 609]
MFRPLKIIIFDGSFKTTAFINRLAKGLAKRNEVYILGFNEELKQKVKGVHYMPLGSNQGKFRFVKTSLGYALKSGSIKKIASAIKNLFQGNKKQLQEQNLSFVLNTINPDIIHLQWPSVISWFEETLQEQKTPLVLSQRGFHNNVRPFVVPENFNYLKHWYPKIAGFHSVSKDLVANGDKIWSSPSKLNHVVYTGLPLSEFLFSSQYERTQPLQLLSVGRTHWKKGYDYALQTCRILKEKHFPFHYTIIGGAGDEELQFLISDLGLQDCVSLMGRLPQKEVFRMMGEASLLLMPSVEEGVPNVAVEAMALGIPVLSTDCGGVPELIEDGVEGWVVPIRDPEAMAEGVMRFSGLSVEEIEKVRLAARKKVERQHSEEGMIEGMERLYFEVLGRFHAGDAESSAEGAEGK